MPNDLLNHKTKCRLCFQRISGTRNNCKITEKFREKFLHLTTIELKSLEKFSNYTCKPCFKTLNEASEFLRKVTENQLRLYAFENEADKAIVKEEPPESCTIHLRQVDIEDFLPKTEVFDDTWVEDQTPEAQPFEEASTSASPDDFSAVEDEDELSSSAEQDVAEQPPSEAFRIRKHSQHKYSLENLEKALHAIYTGELTTHAASKRFEVPSWKLKYINQRHAHLLTEAEELKVKLFVKRRVELEISTSDQDITAYVLRILQQRKESNRIEIKYIPSHWITCFRIRHSDMITELRSDVEFSCDICGFSVTGKRNIKDHMHLHAKAGKVPTRRPRGEYTKEDLKEAVIAVTEGRLTKTQASKQYNMSRTTISFNISKGSEDKPRIHKCSFCDKVYNSEAGKRGHEILKHLTPVGEFSCTRCDKVFSTEKKLNSHRYAYHTLGNGPFKCRDCGQIFEKASSLAAHRADTHREQIACTVCGKLVAKGSKMSRHMKSHAPRDTHKCSFEGCPKSYSDEPKLAYHIRNTHSAKLNIKCSLCEKTFPNQGRLKVHIDRSHGKPRFFCEVDGCNYKNTRRAYLRLHLQNHKDIDTRTKGELIANIKNHKTNR